MTGTLTIGGLVTEATNAVNGFVPDLTIFIGAAAVIGLAAWGLQRLMKAGR